MGQASGKKREQRVARTNSDLLQRLRDQFRFLVRSAQHFDEGDESEAQNLALRIRIFVHDRGQVPLLEQLRVLNQLRFLNTAPPADLANLLPMTGLTAWRIEENETSARWLATLDVQPPERAGRSGRFSQWWMAKVARDATGTLWSRRDFVLAVANQDGGAHVDPGLDPRYLALSRQNAMGWRFHLAGTEDEGEPMKGNPVFASVRQIAWELEWTLRTHLWRELELKRPQPPTFRAPPAPSDDPRVLSGDTSSLPYVSFKLRRDADAARRPLVWQVPMGSGGTPIAELRITDVPDQGPVT